MKKLFESEYSGFDESATMVTVYQFETPEEKQEFYEMEHDDRCSYFDVFDQSGYEVAPGATYHTYNFEISDGILLMYDRIALNV